MVRFSLEARDLSLLQIADRHCSHCRSGCQRLTHRSVFEAGHSPPSTARQRMTGVMSPRSHVPLCHASEVLTNLRLSYITRGFIWFLDLVLSILRRKKLLINGCVSDHRTQHMAAQTQLDSGLVLNLFRYLEYLLQLGLTEYVPPSPVACG